MRKVLLPALLLLGAQQVLASPPKIRMHNLATVRQDVPPEEDDAVNEGETEIELTTWNYHFEEITEFEMEEITTYW